MDYIEVALAADRRQIPIAQPMTQHIGNPQQFALRKCMRGRCTARHTGYGGHRLEKIAPVHRHCLLREFI